MGVFPACLFSVGKGTGTRQIRGSRRLVYGRSQNCGSEQAGMGRPCQFRSSGGARLLFEALRLEGGGQSRSTVRRIWPGPDRWEGRGRNRGEAKGGSADPRGGGYRRPPPRGKRQEGGGRGGAWRW